MKNKLWIALLLILAATLAACQPAAGGGEATEEAGGEATEEAGGGADQVEVFSWWTGGGEAAGLEAMMAVFSEKYPDVEFINAAVAGGAGTNARAVLATRLQANDPPDSWQAHAGWEIIGTYVAGGQVEPLNDLYDEQGWLDVMPETLIPLISEGDNIYSVPVNIHRANVMWYNPTVLEEAGVAVPTTWDEFFTACEAIEANDVICLSLGENWTQKHLLETVLIGELGADAYRGLWTGETDWNSAEVTAALEVYNQIFDHVNSDYASLTWQDASQLVVDGDAAFNIMGDWANGFFTELGLEPGTGYGWAPTPGTDGVFDFLSDSFVLAVGAPHPEGARAWLTVAGSKEGQEAFNPVKGSICARTDCDASLFNEYLQEAMSDWSTDTIVPSLAHGAAANDAWSTAITDAIGIFVGDHDVAAFQEALVAAAAANPNQ